MAKTKNAIKVSLKTIFTFFFFKLCTLLLNTENGTLTFNTLGKEYHVIILL